MEPYPPPPLSNGTVSVSTNTDHHNHHHHHHLQQQQQQQQRPRSTTAIVTNGLMSSDLLDTSSVDAEVAQIQFQSEQVNMRSKKNKRPEAEMAPRPMSWEGELSDGGGGGSGTVHDRDMCIDEETQTQIPENLSLSQSKQCSTTTISIDSKESPILRLKQPPMGSYSLHSTPSNSPLLSQRHPVTGVPMMGHKDLVHKALNVPPTPSPDSAIHSAYSVFSSPNQSPLTQRHVTLTPNLSRNNSDASHSSCCSYSSVSVSVSPTQQFSPTHSPIQVCTYLFY